jgi:hypothetical protein
VGAAKTRRDVERGSRRAARRCALTPAGSAAGHIVEANLLQILVFALGGTAMTRLVNSKLTVLVALIMGWIVTLFVLIANQF